MKNGDVFYVWSLEAYGSSKDNKRDTEFPNIIIWAPNKLTQLQICRTSLAQAPNVEKAQHRASRQLGLPRRSLLLLEEDQRRAGTTLSRLKPTWPKGSHGSKDKGAPHDDTLLDDPGRSTRGYRGLAPPSRAPWQRVRDAADVAKRAAARCWARGATLGLLRSSPRAHDPGASCEPDARTRVIHRAAAAPIEVGWRMAGPRRMAPVRRQASRPLTSTSSQAEDGALSREGAGAQNSTLPT